MYSTSSLVRSLLCCRHVKSFVESICWIVGLDKSNLRRSDYIPPITKKFSDFKKYHAMVCKCETFMTIDHKVDKIMTIFF